MPVGFYGFYPAWTKTRIRLSMSQDGVITQRRKFLAEYKREAVAMLSRLRISLSLSQHQFPETANTLNRAFTVGAPNRVWAGDLTCVWTREGWLYLAVLLDLYSPRVIGWAMGQRLTGELAEQALLMAMMNRTPRVGLLHHSDRGSQYAATSYQRLLDAYGLIPSMSRTGNCWDNACVEGFFGTLKRELVYQRRYMTRSEATQDIFEYIEVFYNRQRRHSTLGYHSPTEYEATAAVA